MCRLPAVVCFVVLLLTGTSRLASSQPITTTTLMGAVTDAATGKPMPFANVYLNGSTRGTLTDEKGHFSLAGVPLGTVEVVASFVGYQLQRQTLRLDDPQPKTLNFQLKPADQTLATITVRGNLRKWQRQLRQFKQQLLGEPFAGQCQIVNSDVLSFFEENGHLKATATEPIQIENQALGYRLRYDLLYFDGTFQKVFYAGTTHFEELKPTDGRQANRFQRNRMRAYLGSTRHLMASLIDSTYQQQGFLVYQENVIIPISRNNENRNTLYGSINRRLKPLIIKTLIRPGKLSFERRLVSDLPLVVFYTPLMSAYSPYADARYAYSQIKIPAGQIQLTVDGTITLPEGMEVQGSLGNDRLSTMLPADWKPDQSSVDVPVVADMVTPGKWLPPDARLKRIAASFNERFQTLAPVVFVQTDKPLYATGDRMWLSAYLLDAATNRRPAGETAMHVDLLTPTGKLVQHQWLRVTDGRAMGDFRLSDSLSSGMYRLRAYTDEDDGQHRPAFDRSIAVYNLFRTETPARSDTIRQSADIQVLPEGGHWIVGLPARLGIKVVAPDGHGQLVTGRIIDESGGEVAQFMTNPLGIGSVVLVPAPGHTYQAEVTSFTSARGNRLVGVAQLPPAEPAGLLLSVDAVSDSSRLMINVFGTNRPAIDSVYVLIQQQGRLVNQRKIQLQQGAATLSMPFALLPSGLNQITLYDAAARPQAERLVFVPERSPLVRALVSVNKTRYVPREQVILNVTLLDDDLSALATLSASVTDADQVPDDTSEATIRTHLLLTGELRGQVEQPNFYAKNNTSETRRALDDLLLTQGWRRVRGTPATELLGGVSLMGRVLNTKNQPIAGAQVMVASTASNKSFVRSAGADETGRFRLAGLAIADTLQMLVQLTDRQFKDIPDKEAHLVLEGPGTTWEAGRSDSLPNWSRVRMQLEAARVRQIADSEIYRDKTVRLLKAVTVRARKTTERPDDIRRMSLHGEPDASLIFDENAGQFANLYEMIRGRLAGVNVLQKDAGYQVIVRGPSSLGDSSPLFLMDGMAVPGDQLLSYNPVDIERVELLKNAGSAGIYGVRGATGVIAFYTKRFRPDQPQTTVKLGMKPLQLIGYSSVQREFYVPRYTTELPALTTSVQSPAEPPDTHVDRRDVLYWKPLMQTDGQGHSQLLFPLSDVVRTLRVRVQGITNDGRPVVGVALIQVQ